MRYLRYGALGQRRSSTVIGSALGWKPPRCTPCRLSRLTTARGGYRPGYSVRRYLRCTIFSAHLASTRNTTLSHPSSGLSEHRPTDSTGHAGNADVGIPPRRWCRRASALAPGSPHDDERAGDIGTTPSLMVDASPTHSTDDTAPCPREPAQRPSATSSRPSPSPMLSPEDPDSPRC